MGSAVGFMDFGGKIKGNSEDAKHKDWIEVSMVSQGISRNINPTSNPKDALATSQVHVGGIEIQKNADESSPLLVAAVCKGEVFPKVTIDLVKTTPDGRDVYYQWTLENVYVSNYGVHGQDMGGQIDNSETLTLCYSKINWSYKKTGKDGKPTGSAEAGWDLIANKTA